MVYNITGGKKWKERENNIHQTLSLKGLKTASELSSIYEVHSTLISNWKKQLSDKGKEIFSNDNNRNEQDAQSLQSALYEEIGRLKFELDGLKLTNAFDWRTIFKNTFFWKQAQAHDSLACMGRVLCQP